MGEPARAITIPDGADLVEALRGALGGTDGWVQAVGSVDGVELRVAGEGGEATRALRGRLTLVALGGPAGGPFMATLARHTGAGLELFGGALLRARASGITAALLPLLAAGAGDGAAPDEAATTPRAGAAAARAGTGAERSARAPEPSAWAAAARASAEAARAAEPPPEESPFPERGDQVQHFAFGLCNVLMSDGESLRIRDVAGAGRVREIRVDKLIVLPPSVRDGRRVFELVRGDGQPRGAGGSGPPGSRSR